MAICIEPILLSQTETSRNLIIDDWEIKTPNKTQAAHIEHTVLFNKYGAYVVTEEPGMQTYKHIILADLEDRSDCVILITTKKNRTFFIYPRKIQEGQTVNLPADAFMSEDLEEQETERFPIIATDFRIGKPLTIKKVNNKENVYSLETLTFPEVESIEVYY